MHNFKIFATTESLGLLDRVLVKRPLCSLVKGDVEGVCGLVTRVVVQLLDVLCKDLLFVNVCLYSLADKRILIHFA